MNDRVAMNFRANAAYSINFRCKQHFMVEYAKPDFITSGRGEPNETKFVFVSPHHLTFERLRDSIRVCH